MIEAGKETIHFAHHLSEPEEDLRQGLPFTEMIEIVEALLLALIAVATAWSGYQAALWDTNRAEQYGESARMRSAAESLSLSAGQEHLYDTTTFNAWLIARSRNDAQMMRVFEQRFRNEYQVAFISWLQTDPFHNSNAQPGPSFMTEYRNEKSERAVLINREADSSFEEGTRSGVVGDRYVRITVLLATVLMLTAISQRFRVQIVRTGLLCVSIVVLCIPVIGLWTLPRL
jgi:hypothetical protein